MVMVAYILIQLCTWVNAAHGVHRDLKICTCDCVSFGYGMVHCKYRNQKINTIFFTKAEVFGVSNYLPYNISICLLMGEQRYDIN